ncbi:toxin-activating lysine-acyltransferase [Salmonella enterica]|nr:toxin-activating lysine-acyltransferase [Salmonella enterica]EAZ9261382.1 toxin-activating lysine-acyltransferase [Salmonella enterica]
MVVDEIDFSVLGKVSWLWSCSPLHRTWPVTIFATNVIPAIAHKKYFLHEENGFPVAYCSWANLSLESELKYIKDTNSLSYKDWDSGDRNWFIDWIAPFGHSNFMYRRMRSMFSEELFRSIHVTPGKSIGKISEFHGSKVDKNISKRLFLQYKHELVSVFNKEKNRGNV